MNPATTGTDGKHQSGHSLAREGLPERLFVLRHKLYVKAKREPTFRFYALYDRICRMDVLMAAWEQVARNGGSPGVDGMSIDAIAQSQGGVEEFLGAIHRDLTSKRYRPSAVKRVYIPKAGGKLRPLGIPTVRDRVVQTAAKLILEPIFEADFLECSFGFRPERSAHDALRHVWRSLKSGKVAVYDADLEGYFDSIPHDRLMACVAKRIADRTVLGLIRAWLRAARAGRARAT